MEFGAMTSVGASPNGWRPCSQGFSTDEMKIFKACSYFWKGIVLPSIRSLVFRNNELSSSVHMLQLIHFTVKTDKNLTLEHSLCLGFSVYWYKNRTSSTPSLTVHTAFSPVCVFFHCIFGFKSPVLACKCRFLLHISGVCLTPSGSQVKDGINLDTSTCELLNPVVAV